MDRRIITPDELPAEQFDLFLAIDLPASTRFLVSKDTTEYVPWLLVEVQAFRWRFLGFARWKTLHIYRLPFRALSDLSEEQTVEVLLQGILGRLARSRGISTFS